MSRPRLSVVVAASFGPDALARTLASIAAARAETDLECLVVHAFDAPDAVTAAADRVVAAPAGTTVPMLRTLGLRAASAPLVALIEDNVVVTPGWASALTAAADADDAGAFGGPVDHVDTGRATDRAVFLYEYGRFMPPRAAGACGGLPGNNLCYRRSLLDRHAEAWVDGLFETFLHARLREAGEPLVMVPEAVVHHVGHYEVGATCRSCFHHARGFAGMRVDGLPAWRRGAFAAGAAALPAVLTGRILKEALPRHARRVELLRSVPILAVFMGCWAAGEAAGYAAGPGGSLQHWS